MLMVMVGAPYCTWRLFVGELLLLLLRSLSASLVVLCKFM
jgi:hypothetical protein